MNMRDDQTLHVNTNYSASISSVSGQLINPLCTRIHIRRRREPKQYLFLNIHQYIV
jgi:hypothetical protein